MMKKCRIEGCNRPFFGLECCSLHYNRLPEVVERRKAWNGKPQSRYKAMLTAARRFNRECTITFTEYKKLIERPCFYRCGNPISPTEYGLDRLDNNQGYTPDNVVPCCGECNRLRRDSLTVEETHFVVQALRAYRNIKKLTDEEKLRLIEAVS